MLHIGGLIKRLDQLNMRIAARKMDNCGLTGPQLNTLNAIYELSENGNEPNQRMLERRLYLKNPTVTGLLGRLEEAGMIERIRARDDARSKRIRITPKGIECRQAVHANLDETERRLTASLTDEEKRLMEKMLLKMIQDIENTEEAERR